MAKRDSNAKQKFQVSAYGKGAESDFGAEVVREISAEMREDALDFFGSEHYSALTKSLADEAVLRKIEDCLLNPIANLHKELTVISSWLQSREAKSQLTSERPRQKTVEKNTRNRLTADESTPNTRKFSAKRSSISSKSLLQTPKMADQSPDLNVQKQLKTLFKSMQELEAQMDKNEELAAEIESIVNSEMASEQATPTLNKDTKEPQTPTVSVSPFAPTDSFVPEVRRSRILFWRVGSSCDSSLKGGQ